MVSPEAAGDRRAATAMASIAFLLFAAFTAGLAAKVVHQVTVAWVGTGLVGLGAALLVAWAIVLGGHGSLERLDRYGGDLLLVGFGVLFVAAGLPTFLAGAL